MANCKFFECGDCGHPNDYCDNVSMTDQQGRIAYYYKRGFPNKKHRIICTECCSDNLELVNYGDVDLHSLSLGKFTMASPQQREAMLRQRSAQHAKKFIHEKKRHLSKAQNMFDV